MEILLEATAAQRAGGEADESRAVASIQNGNRVEKSLCSKCATIHQNNECWAKSLRCRACGVLGHIARCCLRSDRASYSGARRAHADDRKNSWSRRNRRNARVHMIQNCGESSEEESTSEEYEIGAVQCSREGSENELITLLKRKVCEILNERPQRKGDRRWEEIVSIGGERVVITIDTGAEVSVIPKIFFDVVSQRNAGLKLREANTELVSYFGDEHRSNSVVDLPVTHRSCSLTERHIVGGPGTGGSNSCSEGEPHAESMDRRLSEGFQRKWKHSGFRTQAAVERQLHAGGKPFPAYTASPGISGQRGDQS